MNLKIIIPVWGEEYLSSCECILIRSLCQKNNLIKLLENSETEIRFATDKNGADYLANSSIIKELTSKIKINVIQVENHFNDKYLNMTEKYLEGIKFKSQEITLDDYFIFLVPDLFLPDGTLSQIISKLQQKPVIQILGFRLIREKFLADIEQVLNYDNKQITNYMVKNLHPICRTNIFGGIFNTRHPSHVYWIYDDNFVGRGFHLHPIAIQALPIVQNLQDYDHFYTIDDWRFLKKSGFGKRDCLVVQNDSILLLELTSKEAFNTEDPLPKFNISLIKYLKVMAWASISGNTNSIQRRFFRKKIILSRNPETKLTGFKEGVLLSILVLLFSPLIKPLAKPVYKTVKRMSYLLNKKMLFLSIYLLPKYVYHEISIFLKVNRNKSANQISFLLLIFTKVARLPRLISVSFQKTTLDITEKKRIQSMVKK